MKTGPTINRKGSKQNYSTPRNFLDAVERRFGKIVFDLAADMTNRKAHSFYSINDNSLVQPWHKLGGLLWLNPPFTNIGLWAEKCAFEAKLGAKIAFLTPASVGSNWFRDHVHNKAYVLALNGRLMFDGATDPYPKDCMLSVYGFVAPGFTLEPVKGFDVWTWN